jgi:VWFA-related protein
MRALIAVLAVAALAPLLADQLVPTATWLAEANSQSGRGGAPPPAVPSTTARLAERVVRVDIIATDGRGRAIENLKLADFELREDGALQTVEQARFTKNDKTDGTGDQSLQIESDADERTEASRPNTRLFALFLDEYHVSAGDSLRARAALTRFIDETLGPRDLVVVMRPLDSLLTIRLTRDRDRVRQVLETFEGRQGDYTPRSEYERNLIGGTPARIEQVRAQVTISALNALAVHLGSINSEARKTLVVVSEGVPRLNRHRGEESLPTLDMVIRSADRSNVSIYAVDPQDAIAAAAGQPDPADNLRALAAATGGESTMSAAGLSAGLGQIEADSSAYYLLVYTTTERQDGAFHRVQVGIKRPGVTVRSREGYWAVTPDEALLATRLAPRPRMPPEPPAHVSPLVKPWFGASRGADGKTRVTFVWEPAAPVPGIRTRQLYPSRVVLRALGADGTPLFEGAVLPTGTLRSDPSDEARARADFDVPPGTLRLRMSIEDDTGQAIDSDVRDITVRDLSAPVVIGTPEILRARTARDYSVLVKDPDAAPVASREFSRAERLMIRVPIYAPTGTVLNVSARLLNRLGQPMRELPIRQGVAPAAPNEIDLPLAPFASGQYLIEVAAKSPAGEVKDRLEFRVTS